GAASICAPLDRTDGVALTAWRADARLTLDFVDQRPNGLTRGERLVDATVQHAAGAAQARRIDERGVGALACGGHDRQTVAASAFRRVRCASVLELHAARVTRALIVVGAGLADVSVVDGEAVAGAGHEVARRGGGARALGPEAALHA